MKILIAEDDLISRMMLEKILTRWGHEVTAVEDGLEAWDALQQPGAPRLALLDWEMPGLDGVELCQRLHNSPETRSVYVVLITAHNRDSAVIEKIRAVADGYLAKPYEVEALQTRIEAARLKLESR